MKDNSQINEIIIKAITEEELSSTEKAMFDQWLADAGNSQLFENLKNKDYLHQQLMELHTIDAAGDKVFFEQKVAKIQSIHKRKAWYRDVATAAAVILFLTAAAFLWLNTRKTDNTTVSKESVPIAATNKDIAPGQTKALLTLADGKKLVLDSTVDGQFAQQGGTVVVNENGTLKYQEKGQPQSEQFNTLSTAHAQTYGMVLADGSKVWLNAGASIRYPVAFTGSERKVEVTGEVYFEVAHHTNKPFIVHVSSQNSSAFDVQVLGTHFNINAYNDEDIVKTTLLEGSVSIKQGDSVTLLKPGQQAQLSNSFTKVLPVANMDAVTAWKNGRFQFDKVDIDVVMRQLKKWYDIEVVYEGPKPTKLFIGEIERNNMLSQVLRMLKYSVENTGIQFRIEGKKLIVMSSELETQQSNTKQRK
jgi:transmembrane sensor